MGFWDKLRAELIDIIEWLDDSNDTLVYRFERYGNEIKHHAKLVVREGQQAIFVNEGKLADVFGPGTHTLNTQNLPILATLKGWKYGFESPFKAEVYFVSTRQFTDLKWGTRNPIMMRDPEFGPIRLRSFGTYAIRADDPAVLLREIVGTDGHFTTGEITEQLRSIIVSRFASVIAEEQTPALDLASNYDEFGELIRARIADEFTGYGLELSKLVVENISLPEEVEKSLDKRTSMGVLGDLNRYAQFQAANAMEKAAENEGGAAGAGMGMGMGMLMGTQINPAPASATATPPPLPGASVVFHVARNGQTSGPFDLGTLRTQAASGLLTPETLVWRDGMAQWSSAGGQSELRPLFTASPPPPPPPPATPGA
ncbi:MAG: SPFH domain-containing protein [Planctomycetota bacterium]